MTYLLIYVIESHYQAYFLLVFIMLCIVIVPPRILSSSRDVTVEMADEVQLQCFADGSPTPHISWYRYTHTGQRNGEHI